MSDAERPMTQDERDTVKKAGAPATAAAGALAGATAGLVSLAGGPVGMGVGLVLGALGGAAVGGSAAGDVAEATYGEADDAHYRALWEGTPDRPADATFDRARPAYQLGHLAAGSDSYVNRDFTAAEPDLRTAWERDLRSHGEWDAVRRYVRDAYGHARSEGYGVRRDASVIGTGGSAVDPVELERARAGLPSRDDFAEGTVPLYPADLAATTPHADAVAPGESLGERPEIRANQAHHEDADHH